MGRIKTVAKELQAQGIDAKWYQAWSKYFDKGFFDLVESLARNTRWIQSKIDKGYKIFDIAPDGRPFPSDFSSLSKVSSRVLIIRPQNCRDIDMKNNKYTQIIIECFQFLQRDFGCTLFRTEDEREYFKLKERMYRSILLNLGIF